MGNISETGHGINISNFKKAIDICTEYGAGYAPSNSNLTIENMTSKWASTKELHDTLNKTLQLSKIPINDRETTFKTLSKKITKISGIVGSLNVGTAFKMDVKGLADKIRGVKTGAKKQADGAPDPNDVSNSHMSYVMRAENYKNLIDLLATTPMYAPNEPELKISSLMMEHTIMSAMNDNIGTIIAPVNKARILRNDALYNDESGVLAIMKACKSYVKGIYGASSPEYKLLTALKFSPGKK